MQRESDRQALKHRLKTKWIISAVAVLFLVGCANNARWENHGIDQSLWAQDQSFCRRDAERRAGVEQTRELGRAEVVGGRSGGSRFRQDMIRHDATRYAAKLYEACLRARGYKKVNSER